MQSAPESAVALRPSLPLLGRILALYRPDAVVPPLADPETVRRELRVWRWRVFLAATLGYFVL